MFYFIMPVGSDPEYATKRMVLESLLQEFRAVGHFPLEDYSEAQFKAEVAVSEMGKADAIIADLAFERPSCYFEVGLAQGAGLKVELIAPVEAAIHQIGGREHLSFYAGVAEYEHLVRRFVRLHQ